LELHNDAFVALPAIAARLEISRYERQVVDVTNVDWLFILVRDARWGMRDVDVKRKGFLFEIIYAEWRLASSQFLVAEMGVQDLPSLKLWSPLYSFLPLW